MTVIRIVVETVPKRVENRLDELKIREKVKTIPTTVSLKSVAETPPKSKKKKKIRNIKKKMIMIY